MNRHLVTLCIVLFATSLANGMDMSNTSKKPGREIQFFQHMCFPRSFPQIFGENISSDISGHLFDVLCFASPVLLDGARHINHFSGVCKSMNILIKCNTLPLIKKLSEAYGCSNENAAYALQTKTASKIVFKQLGFATICAGPGYISPAYSLHIKKNNIDLNFTYGPDCETQLMCASSSSGGMNRSGRPCIVEWLIKNDAPIDCANRSGSTAPFMALDTLHNGDKQLIEYFWDHPSFNINDIRWFGYRKTLLMHIILKLHFDNQNPIDAERKSRRSIRLALLHKLLARGADPELGSKPKNGCFRTPLNLAEQFEDEEVITIIKDAIAKKHTQEKKIFNSA